MDLPGRKTFTYDVTAVSEDGQYVPLAADAGISAAYEIAQARSQDAHWSEVQVKDSGTGELIAAYRAGRRS
jgi:hypothetical protein